jgi:ABC-type dipeptide/oligopeptide/nickel transport system ATPase subunit
LTGPDRGEVLRVGQEFLIFGRRYRICKDPAREQAAPLVIRSGEMVYLKAGSGVGKTTLAKIIMGLYRPQRFAMTLSGEALTQDTSAKVWESGIWGKKASMVFQLADESLDLEVNITETFRGLPLAQKSTAHDIISALSLLFDPEGLTHAFLRRKTAFLSGGQKQRLNLLRSLVLNTGLVILDEPLNGLDFTGVRRVLDLLEQKRSSGAALLLISHNEEIFDALVGREHVYYLSVVPG